MGNITLIIAAVALFGMGRKRLFEREGQHGKLQKCQSQGQINTGSDQEHEHDGSPHPAAHGIKKCLQYVQILHRTSLLYIELIFGEGFSPPSQAQEYLILFRRKRTGQTNNGDGKYRIY